MYQTVVKYGGELSREWTEQDDMRGKPRSNSEGAGRGSKGAIANVLGYLPAHFSHTRSVHHA